MTLSRLSDAIASLRAELEYAQKEGEGKKLQFNIGTIELELEVIVEQEVSGNAKINWWILAGGAEAKMKDADKHKLKLTLQAVDASGAPLRVSKSQDSLPE
jgi:Trypsin-co-occurring domain 2